MSFRCIVPRSFLDCFKGRFAHLLVAVSVLLAVSALATPADAHKVNIFAYAQDGKVHAEGYFVDGTKCRNSLISVIDEKTGEKLLEGPTDDNGQFAFDIPRVTALKLILHAGTGHQNEYVISEEEIRGAAPAAKKAGKRVEQKKAATPSVPPMKSERTARSGEQTVLPPTAPSEDMEALVGRVVDSKLQPVMRLLVKLQEQSEKPGITDIVGGIGYIIGIMGIIGYLKGRAERRNKREQ